MLAYEIYSPVLPDVLRDEYETGGTMEDRILSVCIECLHTNIHKM